MYSIDDLLHLVNSDRADALRLYVGDPPVILLDGEPYKIEVPSITAEDAKQFLHSITNTRQRLELSENGTVRFVYRFRRITDFVVSIQIQNEIVKIDIQ